MNWSLVSLQILINYHMSVLGQLAGLSGHISPLAAYSSTRDMALLMDVWWETRPVWVKLPDLWNAMDQVDPTSGKKVALCKRNDQHYQSVSVSERLCSG